MNAFLRNERGGALLISLCLLGMLTILAIIAVDTANDDMELAFDKVNSDKAFYIAEAGAKRAVAQLRGDTTWRDGFAGVTFGTGSYSVAVTDSSIDSALVETLLVVSVAEVNEASVSVELHLLPVVTRPFMAALFGDDSVAIKNTMCSDSYNSDSGTYAGTSDTLHGDVGSNGTMHVCNMADVGGDVATSLAGGLNVHPGATVRGDVFDDAPVQDLPPIPPEEFAWAEANNNNLTGISGSYNYNPSTHKFVSAGHVELSSGVYYFSSFTLRNAASLSIAPGANVTIYVDGLVEIKNSGDVNPGGKPADLMFLSSGDLALKNGGECFAVFYNPEGTAQIMNSADFYGAVVGAYIDNKNSACFHYDRSLADKSLRGIEDYDVVAWREM